MVTLCTSISTAKITTVDDLLFKKADTTEIEAGLNGFDTWILDSTTRCS